MDGAEIGRVGDGDDLVVVRFAEETAAVAGVEGVEGDVDCWARQRRAEGFDGDGAGGVGRDGGVVAVDPGA